MTSPTQERKSLRKLRESTGTLFAKNNTNKKITCNTDNTSFELNPVGEDDSIRIVPKECLDVPGFQRLWMRRSITVSDDEAMENEITLLMGGQVAYEPKVYTFDKQGQEIQVEAQMMAPAADHDIVFQTNTEEGSRAFGQVVDQPKCLMCGTPVFIGAKFLEAGEPPLCPDHANEKNRIVSTPQPDGTWDHRVAQIQPVQKTE